MFSIHKFEHLIKRLECLISDEILNCAEDFVDDDGDDYAEDEYEEDDAETYVRFFIIIIILLYLMKL